MARNKKHRFSRTQNELAAYAKALAHPARIAILQAVAARGECICGEIVDVMPLAQATVSQHLKALGDAGLITGRIDGPRSCYSVNRAALERFGQAFRLFYDRTRESCC